MDGSDVPARPAAPPRVPEQVPPAGRGRGPARAVVVCCVLALAVGLVVVLTDDDGGGPADRRALTAPGFRAADPGTVVLDGVSGTVQVTADADARAVTGSFHRADGRPAALRGATVDDPASGGRALSLRCEDDRGLPQPCAGDLVLTLPPHTGLRLRQTSGVAVLRGLGGDLGLDASSIQLTTRDLRSPHAEVTVVSGSADIGFAAAPADLDLHASSASVAVRLPRTGDGYAVTTTAASADVQVLVPRDPSAGHRVALTVASGSLSVQDA
nr:hypothetical protein OH826_14305 [Streptomyces sp. NBC_00899]